MQVNRRGGLQASIVVLESTAQVFNDLTWLEITDGVAVGT